MAQDRNVNTEKYNGPGQLGQAFAVGTTWGVAGFFAGAVTGLVGIGKAFKDTMAAGVSGASTKGLKGSTLIKASVFIAPLAFAIGSVRGWMHAGSARDQFDAMKAELSESQKRAELAEGKLETVSNALQEAQTKFAEQHRPKPEHHAKKEPMGFHHPQEHGSHTDHTPHSKAEHGSHADAVRASQHEAEHAELGV